MRIIRMVPATALAWAGLLLAAPALPAAGATSDSRPNLIAVVTDDQGRWAMGAYGNNEVRTPNMDRIAREGALFENAFISTPVCSPSRATYLSGRYSTECRITDWISNVEAGDGLGLAQSTWVQVLKAAGYRTALVGKWHLGEKPEFHPTRLGFDHFYGFLGGGNRPMNPTLEVEGQTQQLQGSLPDLLTDDAIRFLEANRDQPFALLLHFRAPHTPYGPVPEIDSSQYDALDPTVPAFPGADVEQLKTKTRAYYASVSSVDRNLGRLLESLDRLGLAQNTLLVFTSDHGYNLGRHGISTKGNGTWMAGGVNGPARPNMWETSIRTPLAMRWPAVIRPGTKIDTIVTQLDMYRFVLGALKVPLPPRCKARGMDFSPLLSGGSIAPREVLFGQYDLHNNGLAYMRMVRTPEWKYVRHFHSPAMDELYNLAGDPDEKKNRLRGGVPRDDEDGQVLTNLNRRLVEWMRSINDPLLDDPY